MIRKYVRRMEMIPTGYRIAWLDYRTGLGVAYPLGIHVIAWCIWRIWGWSFFPLPESEAQKLRARHAEVYEENHRLHEENGKLLDENTRLQKELRAATFIIRAAAIEEARQ